MHRKDGQRSEDIYENIAVITGKSTQTNYQNEKTEKGRTCKMHRGHGQNTENIYENDFKGAKVGKEIMDHNSMRIQSSELTESNSVRNRLSRAAPVCLALLCFLLLTAVIVLCVCINVNNKNYTQERNQLMTRITNITEERDQLKSEKNELQMSAGKVDGWLCYQSSLYFISIEKKNWSESRSYCTERGADLIIINSSQENIFIREISVLGAFWIGLTESDEEGRWEWVDGSNVTSGFWASGEPNGYVKKDCAASLLTGWVDYTCNDTNYWICEKIIFK